MRRDELSDLAVFLAVAEERSFTRAAARLGTSQSSLSQIVRRLEARMGLKLLTRTTRQVAPTEAGDQLLATLRPAFDVIDERLNALSSLRDRPSGTIRITTGKHAADTVLWPVVTDLLNKYPEVSIELSIDSQLTDIVSERFDAGVRLGESLAKDMVAVRIGPDLRMAVVASPAYLETHERPIVPHDLTNHRCINLRMPTKGGLYAWEFEKDGREINVRVDGPLIVNDVSVAVKAAIDGIGIAFLMKDYVSPFLKSGALVHLLKDWTPAFAGYHLYYPDRRELPAAFRLFVDELRRQAKRSLGA